MISEFFDYMRYIRWLSEKTIDNYYNTYIMFDRFMRNLWKDINDPYCITLEDVNNFVIVLRKKWDKPITTNGKLHFIRRYLAYCRDIKDMDVLNPIKIISSKVEERKIWYHTQDRKTQIFSLVNRGYWRTFETKLRNKLMVYMLYFTWLRVSELANLKVEDINTTTQIIGKWKRLRFTYIRPELMDMIKNYIDRRAYKWEYLFNTIYKWNIRRLKPLTIDKIFERMWEKLWFRVNPHSFRHTFATDLLKVNWCSIYDIATLLGHKEISTTAIYLWVDSDHLKKIQFWLQIN